jgi:hypothetical protein
LKVGEVGKESKHCVQFPYMASVLSDLRADEKRHKVATIISIISLIMSVIAIFVTLL